MPSKELVPRPAVQPPAAIPAPPWEQPKRRGESGARLTVRMLKRNGHLTVPLAVPVALWLAGLACWSFGWKWYVLIAGIVGAGAVWFFSAAKWDRPAEQAYARLSAACAMAWLFAAACIGPARGGTAGITLASVLAVLCTAWGWLWWKHHRPRGRRKRENLIGKWDAWWQSHAWAWNLGGSAIVEVWLMGVTTKVEVAGIAGRHSIQHVRQVLHLIESGLDGHVDVGMIRCETVPRKPSHFYLYFKQANPLEQVVEYDPALAPQSVHDMAPLGLTETGSWKTVTLRCNSFIIGTTRSGKTNYLLMRLACLTGCPDDRPVLIALKGGRSARPVLEAGAAEYVITNVDESRMYLLMLTAEIDARGKYAYTGDDQLYATEEIPAIHTLIDETHGLTSVTNGDADCSRYVATGTSQGSAVECYYDIDTQYGSLEESVRTEQTRGNLKLRVVFRVEMAEHGQFAIPDWAKLDASKLEELGTCYVKFGKHSSAEQVRTPHMPHDLLKRVAAQNAALLGPRPPLRLYCGSQMSPAGVTWQQWWDTRWLRLDEAFRAISPQYQTAVAGHPRDAAQVLAHAAEAAGPPPSAGPGAGDARSAAARIGAELDAARVPDGWTPPEVSLAPVIARKKAAFAGALAGASERGGISPAQLTAESGMSRSWTQQMLRQLGENDAVTQLSRGLYVPAAGTDIGAAIRKVQAGHDELLAEARQKIHAA